MVGPPPEHSRTPPLKSGLARVLCHNVGLAWHLPAAINGCVVKPEALVRRAGPTQGRIVRSLEHRRFSEIVLATSLQHQHTHTFHGQRVGHLATARSGAYYNDIVVRARSRLS